LIGLKGKGQRIARVGIVCALPEEAAALLGRKPAYDRLIRWGGARVVASGTGEVRAAAAAEALVADGCTALLSFGTAGALCPSAYPGMLLLPEEIHAHRGVSRFVDRVWRARVLARLAPGHAIHSGALFTAGGPVATGAAKAALAISTGSIAVDMETAAVAAVAAAHGLPHLAVRAVVDGAHETLPGATLAAITDQGQIRPHRFLLALARSPGDLGPSLRLAFAFRTALGQLRDVARLAQDILCLA
jgi:nucleoside phosphorylase